MSGSELLGSQQGVGQIEQQAERDDSGERVVEDHDHPPLQSLAGVGVADRQCEKADREGEHQNVHHGVLLVAAGSVSIPLLRNSKTACGTSRPHEISRLASEDFAQVPLGG